MNFGKHATWNDTSKDWNADGFGVCDNAKNNGGDRAVTFYYSTPVGAIKSGDNISGNAGAKLLKTTAAVSWSDIHTR